MQKFAFVSFVLLISSINCIQISSRYSLSTLRRSPNRITCKQIVLKNGRVRYRQKTGFAQFQCNKSYLLAGEKYMKCIHGKWEGDIPKCVKDTCLKPKQPMDGFVFPSFRGAVLNFFCKAEYKLIGPAMIYCDDDKWSDHLPTCIAGKSNASINCDFEREDLCGWSHDLNHDFDWTRMQFQTPSGHIGTGPSHDHTTGNGYYMYIEATSRNENDTAHLISPMHKSQENNTCLEFYYHMFGANVGELRVYMKKADDTWDLKPEDAVFRMAGNRGNAWHRSFIHLGAIDDDFQIIMEGIRGSFYLSDIAIDDVQLIENCPEPEEVTSESTTTEEFTTESYEINSCYNRCGVATEDDHCDCMPECILNNSCCPDYIAICVLSEDFDNDNATDDPISDLWTAEVPTDFTTDYEDNGSRSEMAVTSQLATETNDGHGDSIEVKQKTLETNVTTNNNESNEVERGNSNSGETTNDNTVGNKTTGSSNVDRKTVDKKTTSKNGIHIPNEDQSIGNKNLTNNEVGDETKTNDNKKKMVVSKNGTAIVENNDKNVDERQIDLPNEKINITNGKNSSIHKNMTEVSDKSINHNSHSNINIPKIVNKTTSTDSNVSKNGAVIKKPTSNSNSIVPTSNEASGKPKSNNESGMPKPPNEVGSRTSNKASGVPISNNESGNVTSNKASGVPISNNESGMPTSNNESGMPTLNNASGMSAPNNKSGMPISNNDSGMSTSNNNSSPPISSKPEVKPVNAMDTNKFVIPNKPDKFNENNIFKDDMLTVPVVASTNPDWELVTEIARLLSEKKSEPITKIANGHPSALTVVILICLGLVGAVGGIYIVRRKYICVRFRGIRSHSYGDSQSDVRFLTGDEVLNFELACPE